MRACNHEVDLVLPNDVRDHVPNFPTLQEHLRGSHSQRVTEGKFRESSLRLQESRIGVCGQRIHRDAHVRFRAKRVRHNDICLVLAGQSDRKRQSIL